MNASASAMLAALFFINKLHHPFITSQSKNFRGIFVSYPPQQQPVGM